ncbi:unnamed protein product [Brassicogethes aeneus]|uniref:Tetraspanin n=1 Tax=Brassicogethes aeneus TaxID=1431903 RepID=A0A9P0B428_BRAAE|nr:unnamed protein product [Brassicogethes aeneus]
MGCASGFVKVILQTANVLLCLAGLVLIAIGGFALTNVCKYDLQSFQLGPIFTIVVGSIIFLISLMGCFGVFQENSWMLSSYVVLLLGIFIVQVGLGIYSFMEINNDYQLQHTITKQLDIIYKNDKDHEFKNMIEKGLQCCIIYYDNNYDGFITSALGRPICMDPTVLTCDKTIFNLIRASFKYIAFTLLGMLITQLICSVFAIILVNSIKNEKGQILHIK